MQIIKIVVLGLICYLLLFWFAGSAGLVLLPALVALLIYVLGRDEVLGFFGQSVTPKFRPAITLMLLGAAIGFLGGLLAVFFLTAGDYVAYANQAQQLGKDLSPRFFVSIYAKLVLANQVNNMAPVVFVFITTILTAFFSFWLGLIKKDHARFASWALVALICLLFTNAVFQATGNFRQHVAEEPPDLSYRYDGVVYLRTFHRMAEKDFYTGYIEAAAGHQGVARDRNVRDGKFYGYVHSPFYFRTPTAFWLMRILTFGNAVGVIYLGIISALALLVLSYLAGKSLIGESGVFLTIVLVPYMVAGSVWHNLFFPDWWAAIALTAGILFWLRQQFWLSAMTFLLASGFREIVFWVLIVFLIFTLVFKKEARLQFALATGLFVAIYPWHYFKASGFIGLEGQEISSIVSRVSSANFSYSSSYMTYVYNFFFGPTFIIMLIALVVWYWKRRYDMLALTALAFPYFAYASSSYWGQHLLPFIIFSASMVFFLKRDKLNTTEKSTA